MHSATGEESISPHNSCYFSYFWTGGGSFEALDFTFVCHKSVDTLGSPCWCPQPLDDHVPLSLI